MSDSQKTEFEIAAEYAPIVEEKLLEAPWQERKILFDMKFPGKREAEAQKKEYDAQVEEYIAYQQEKRKQDKYNRERNAGEGGFWEDQKRAFGRSVFSQWGGFLNTIGFEDNFLQKIAADPSLQERDDIGDTSKFMTNVSNAAGSTYAALPAMASGNASVLFAYNFATYYGDTVDRNISYGMGKIESRAEAFFESAMLAAVEQFLGSVPGAGKALSKIPGAKNISKVAKLDLAAAAWNKFAGKVGKKYAANMLYQTTKDIATGSAGEAAEETLQTLFESVGEAYAETRGSGTPFGESLDKHISAEEMKEAAKAGAIGGGFLGGVGSSASSGVDYVYRKGIAEPRLRKQDPALDQAFKENRVQRVVDLDGRTVGYRVLQEPLQQGQSDVFVAENTPTVPTYPRPQQTATPVADTAVTTDPAATSAFDIFAYGDRGN